MRRVTLAYRNGSIERTSEQAYRKDRSVELVLVGVANRRPGRVFVLHNEQLNRAILAANGGNSFEETLLLLFQVKHIHPEGNALVVGQLGEKIDLLLVEALLLDVFPKDVHATVTATQKPNIFRTAVFKSDTVLLQM